MGPVLDFIGRKEIKTTMEASTSKNHHVQMPKDKNMISDEEVEVDVVNCMTDDEDASAKPQSEDATGSSSSFGDTFSEVGNREYQSDDDDDDVMSELRVDGRGFGELFPRRKKRLTSHWRKFIQPIMWRCKWVELKIKKFQSQAIKYDKEIKKYHQTEPLNHVNSECAKSVPFSHNSQREILMKRKKRKRHEESDIEAYMSQHNLFSHFATRKSTIGVATMDDDQTNRATSTVDEFKVPDEMLSLEFKDDYNLLEQILWKIEVAQSQVSEMKNKLDNIKIENAERFPTEEEINLHNKESDSSKNHNGSSVAALFASELMKYNTVEDLVKPQNATSSHGDLQDINEKPPVASTNRSTDGMLIYNRRAKKPQTDVKIHPIEKLQIPKEEKTDVVSISEDSSSQNDQPAPKLRSVSKLTAPKNKKKRAARARRKGSSSLWSRRTSA